VDGFEIFIKSITNYGVLINGKNVKYDRDNSIYSLLPGNILHDSEYISQCVL
jgi:hypothetical protein